MGPTDWTSLTHAHSCAHSSVTFQFGPNGIALIDDELLIVDLMGSGLEYRVDVETGNVVQIEFSNVEAIYSPDCQRYVDGRLLTVSNAAGGDSLRYRAAPVLLTE
jgi:hypothetical protein